MLSVLWSGKLPHDRIVRIRISFHTDKREIIKACAYYLASTCCENAVS